MSLSACVKELDKREWTRIRINTDAAWFACGQLCNMTSSAFAFLAQAECLHWCGSGREQFTCGDEPKDSKYDQNIASSISMTVPPVVFVSRSPRGHKHFVLVTGAIVAV